MKKFFFFLGIVLWVLTSSLLPGEGLAKGWILYDDFNSGVFDENLWVLDQSGGSITIENGRAKFVTQPTAAPGECILIFQKNVDKIRGIRVTVTVDSLEGDMEAAGIGCWVGKLGDNYVWNELGPQYRHHGYLDGIWGYLWVIKEGTGGWIYDIFTASFEKPIDIIGGTFTISTIFDSREEVTYEVNGLGEIRLNLPQTMSKTDNFYKIIHTIGRNIGPGKLVVYFDDVYVLK